MGTKKKARGKKATGPRQMEYTKIMAKGLYQIPDPVEWVGKGDLAHPGVPKEFREKFPAEFHQAFPDVKVLERKKKFELISLIKRYYEQYGFARRDVESLQDEATNRSRETAKLREELERVQAEKDEIGKTAAGIVKQLSDAKIRIRELEDKIKVHASCSQNFGFRSFQILLLLRTASIGDENQRDEEMLKIADALSITLDGDWDIPRQSYEIAQSLLLAPI